MAHPPITAYFSVFLKVINAQPRDFVELETKPFLIFPDDHEKTVQYAMRIILGRRIKRHAATGETPPGLVRMVKELIPSFNIQYKNARKGVKDTNSHQINFTAKELFRLKVGDPRWLFMPRVDPDVIAETFEVSGTMALGQLGSIEEIAGTLMTKFALSTMTTATRDGHRIQYGRQTVQTKADPRVGQFIGFDVSWIKSHELIFHLSVKDGNQSVKIKGTVPGYMINEFTELPDTVKLTPVTIVYPRHHMSGLQMVMQLTSNSVAPYVILQNRKMGSSAVVELKGSDGISASGVYMEVQYDGGSVHVRGDQNSAAYETALRFAAYANGLPLAKFPPHFEILVPISGYTYGVNVEDIRRAQTDAMSPNRDFTNRGDRVSYKYDAGKGQWMISFIYPNRREKTQRRPAGRSDIDKYGMVPGFPRRVYRVVNVEIDRTNVVLGEMVAKPGTTGYLEEDYVLTIEEDGDQFYATIYRVNSNYPGELEVGLELPQPAKGEYDEMLWEDQDVDDFLESRDYVWGDDRNLHTKDPDIIQFWHDRPATLEFPSNHVWLPDGMQLTTVSRRIPKTGDSGNTSSNVTNSLSSPAFIAPEWHAHYYPLMTTAILWVRMSQRASGMLVLIRASECVFYSRKYQTLVVFLGLIPDHTKRTGRSYEKNVLEDLHREKSGDYPMGGSDIVIKQARFLPEEFDDWSYIDDPRITSNTVAYPPEEQLVTDGVVEYYVAYFNSPGKPFFLLANVEIPFGGRISQSILYANPRDRNVATLYPAVKYVSRDFPYQPDFVVATPKTVTTTRKRDFPRPGKPGTYGTIHFGNGWPIEVFTPPFKWSQFFAPAIAFDKKIRRWWRKAYGAWQSNRSTFEESLLSNLNLTSMERFEWWFELGYHTTGEKTPDSIMSPKFGTHTKALVDALEKRYSRDIYILLTHKTDSTDDRDPDDPEAESATKAKTMRVTLMHRPRLWERQYDPQLNEDGKETNPASRKPIFLWSRNPLTHANPTADPYYHLATFVNEDQEEAVLEYIRSIPTRPSLPEGTRFISFNNDGPVAAFDEYMGLLGRGPFALSKSETYVHWSRITQVDVLGESRTDSRYIGHATYTPEAKAVYVLPDNDIIYYAWEMDVVEGNRGYYITSNLRSYLMNCANATMTRVAKSTIVRFSDTQPITTPRTVPGTTGLADNFYQNASAFRDFYDNSGIRLKRVRGDNLDNDNIAPPRHMAIPFRLEKPKYHDTVYHVLNE